MNRRLLGRTGLRVSELCLGTIGFGWATNRETSLAILDAFADAGGNFIQATSVYPEIPDTCTWTNLSELYLGEWLEANAPSRQDMFVSTRVTINTGEAETAARHLRLACEASLRKLKTTYLDLLVCQWHPSFFQTEVLLREMTSLVQSGEIRYFGFAGFPLWRVTESLHTSRSENHCRIESFQTDYSLLERTTVEREIGELCRERRVALLATSPLAGGYLGGRLDAMPENLSERSRRLTQRYNTTRGRKVLSALESVALATGHSTGSIALAWTLHNPALTSAIVGVRTIQQLNEAVRATSLDLGISELHSLDLASSATGVRCPATRRKRQIGTHKYPSSLSESTGRLAPRRLSAAT
ncbi:MAG TPA: aldo/keto reductase [Opitutaceae bacterium]|nr:aldo/keto reductase [Opitutaceae bacterium]